MQTMSSQNNFNVMTNYYEKNVSHLSQKIKTIEASRANNIRTGERIIAATTFQGLWVVSFQTKQKNVRYALLYLSLPCISRGQYNKYCVWEANLVFYI